MQFRSPISNTNLGFGGGIINVNPTSYTGQPELSSIDLANNRHYFRGYKCMAMVPLEPNMTQELKQKLYDINNNLLPQPGDMVWGITGDPIFWVNGKKELVYDGFTQTQINALLEYENHYFHNEVDKNKFMDDDDPLINFITTLEDKYATHVINVGTNQTLQIITAGRVIGVEEEVEDEEMDDDDEEEGEDEDEEMEDDDEMEETEEQIGTEAIYGGTTSNNKITLGRVLKYNGFDEHLKYLSSLSAKLTRERFQFLGVCKSVKFTRRMNRQDQTVIENNLLVQYYGETDAYIKVPNPKKNTNFCEFWCKRDWSKPVQLLIEDSNKSVEDIKRDYPQFGGGEVVRGNNIGVVIDSMLQQKKSKDYFKRIQRMDERNNNDTFIQTYKDIRKQKQRKVLIGT